MGVTFNAKMSKNKQVTLKAEAREEHDIEPQDVVWLEVKRVVDKKGRTKYP